MSGLLTTSIWLLLLLALLWGLWGLWREPPTVTLRREQPQRGFEGRREPGALHLSGRARLPTRLWLEVPYPPGVVPDTPFTAGGLLWGDFSFTQRTRLSLNSRGVHTFAAPTLRWADPLGLFWRRVTLPAGDRLVVYPGTHGLTLPALLRPLLSEGELSRQLGLEDPISLRGVRPYAPGDPPGRVHWRQTARTGELMVRELERTVSSSLQVHLDLQGSPVYVESAVRLAASLIGEALELDLPVSVSGGEAAQGGLPATPAGRTPEALQRGLERLAGMRAGQGGSAIPLPRPGSNLIVLTQHAGDELLQAALLSRAAAGRVVIVALPEGFYLEPGESPRRQWAGLPDALRELERKAGVLAAGGVQVKILRGDMRVASLGEQGG